MTITSPYIPAELPLDNLDYQQLFGLVGSANAEYGIHEKTTSNLLKQLKEAGILRELVPASGRKSAILYFHRLLDITG